METPRLVRSLPRHVPVTPEQSRRHRLRPLPALGLFVGTVLVVDDWLELPIGDGWIAAFRLVYRGRGANRTATILELRVFPDERDRKHGGEWSAAYRGNKAKAPDRPFAFERLKRITAVSFNTALAATTAHLASVGARRTFGRPAQRLQRSAEQGRGAGRPGLLRSHYARVAVRYEEIEYDGTREGRTSTREILRAEFNAPSVAAVGKWLTVARKHGFLTAKVARGQRGDRATELARQVAAAMPVKSQEK